MNADRYPNPVARREFIRSGALGLTALALPASWLAALGGRRHGERGAPRPGRSAAAGLPPRTVGLRTSGGDFRFDPVGLRIGSGDTVVWLNMGDFHTASAFHPDNNDLVGPDVPLRIPRGAESWHSGMLGLTGGTEFEHRFEVEGVYDYFCQPHYGFGMVGRIIVEQPRGGPALARPLAELNPASREVMPSVSDIMGPGGRTYEWASRVNGLLLLRARRTPTAAAAAALEDAVVEDEILWSVLRESGGAAAFRRELDRFLAALEAEDGYDRLVARADSAKHALREARASG